MVSPWAHSTLLAPVCFGNGPQRVLFSAKDIQLHGALQKRKHTGGGFRFFDFCQIRWNLLHKLQTTREWKHSLVHTLKLKPSYLMRAYTHTHYTYFSFRPRKRFAAHCVIIISWYEVKIPMDTGKIWLKLQRDCTHQPGLLGLVTICGKIRQDHAWIPTRTQRQRDVWS